MSTLNRLELKNGKVLDVTQVVAITPDYYVYFKYGTGLGSFMAVDAEEVMWIKQQLRDQGLLAPPKEG
jgi:hypothetical protein